jgi:branched-chain amino acid transport system substrate-binding protein
MFRALIGRRVRRAMPSPGWRVGAAAAVVAGMVVASGPALGSVAGAAKSSGKSPLYIGSVLGTSGVYASFDGPQYVGLKTVINQIDKSGGLLGHKLIYVNINDDSESTKFGPAIEQLLQEHKFLAIFPTPVGYQAQLTYTNAEKVITFGGGDPIDTEFNPAKYPYDFNDAPLNTDQLVYAADALQKWGGSKPKVGIMVNSLTASEAEMTALSKLLKTEGVTVLPIQTVTSTATDVTLQLSQLESAGATVVYPFPNGSLCKATFAGVQTLAWKVKVLGNADCLSKAVVDSIPSTVLPEVRYFAVNSTTLAKNGKPRSAAIAAFAKQVLAGTATSSIGIAGVSADAIHDLVWAADEAKSVTSAKILKELNSMFNAKIPAGTFYQEPNPRWSPSDHVMDRATLSQYYVLANVSSPQKTGFWALTSTLATAKKP